MRSRLPYLALALLWAGLIAFLSSRPGSATPPMPHPVDWVVHCGAFFGLGFLVSLAIGLPRRVWMTVVLVSCFGMCDEFHQYFVPGRDCSVGDWLADTTGATAAAVAWLLAWKQGNGALRNLDVRADA